MIGITQVNKNGLFDHLRVLQFYYEIPNGYLAECVVYKAPKVYLNVVYLISRS